MYIEYNRLYYVQFKNFTDHYDRFFSLVHKLQLHLMPSVTFVKTSQVKNNWQ